MRFLHRTFIFIAFIILAVSINASAMSDGYNYWQPVEIIPADVKSGSELTYAAARIKYDYPSNRIRFVFMISCDGSKVTDESLVGICFNINGLGEAVIMADADMDYDDSVYGIAFEDVRINKSPANVMIEASVIIKNGLKPNNTMTAYFFDTNGVRSSSFTVDISDETYAASEQSNPTDKADMAQKAVKSTTVKTTKEKTEKTTKEKTTKTSKDKSAETDISDESESLQESELTSVNNIQTDDRISEEKDSVKQIAVIAGAVTAAAAIAAGCVIGIKNSKKNQTKK